MPIWSANVVSFDVAGELWANPLPEHLHLKDHSGPRNRTVPPRETRPMDERLLDLYNTELRHLRETAAEFGRDFPKIAGRLSLDLDAKEICPDPYVERLLEGFCLFARRVHLKAGCRIPSLHSRPARDSLSDYLCPVPSMGIVKFEPQEQEGALADGFPIKRGTLMRSQLTKGDRTACTFSTAHDVRLLPLTVTEARYFIRDLAELNLPRELGARAGFRIRLRKTLPKTFQRYPRPIP